MRPPGNINQYDRLHNIWGGMNRRCKNPTNPDWKDYGGRGIKVSPEWQDYKNFKEWSLSNGYDDTLSLDRIDNNGDYSPDNCRWATNKQQANNKRNNRKVTLGTQTKNLTEWLEFFGISKGVYKKRIKRGWTQLEAITRPLKDWEGLI